MDRPDRVFQVWAYKVGMGQLLLRSTKSNSFGTRVDVMFQNVKAMKLPTLLHGLLVTKAGGDQLVRVSQDTGLLPDGETIIFVVRGSAYEGYVVAGVCVQAEDLGEYYDPSAVWHEP